MLNLPTNKSVKKEVCRNPFRKNYNRRGMHIEVLYAKKLTAGITSLVIITSSLTNHFSLRQDHSEVTFLHRDLEPIAN